MLLIHVPKITNRVKYIFTFILRDILRTEFELTSDKENYIGFQGPKFCYGKQAIDDTLFFSSNNLLFEEDIHNQTIEFFTWKESKVFFQVSNNHVLPFDMFAASFYLVSRYPEYLPHTKDRHNRIKAEDSINFKGGFLDRPIINIWAKHLSIILSDKLNMVFYPAPYTFTPTIEINNAYAYKYKGRAKTAMAILEHLVRFQFKRLIKRTKVVSGMVKDPFDSYEEQDRIHKKYHLKPYFFVLLGDYGKYDKSLNHTNNQYIKLIQALDKTGEVCLHPSYRSFDNPEYLLQEKRKLEEILQRPVTKSRQHYLRMTIPGTYRDLIQIGIKEDYSMGYASRVGFRAGTSTPFYFFDVARNEQSELKIFPLIAMDTTLKHYLRLRSKEVIPFLNPVVSEIKSIGGNFIFSFHNESIANSGPWKNWGDMYERVIKLAMDENDTLIS